MTSVKTSLSSDSALAEQCLRYSTEQHHYDRRLYRSAADAVDEYVRLRKTIAGLRSIDPAAPVVDTSPTVERLHIDRLQAGILRDAFERAAQHPTVGRKRWIVWAIDRFDGDPSDVDDMPSPSNRVRRRWISATDTAVEYQLDRRGLLADSGKIEKAKSEGLLR